MEELPLLNMNEICRVCLLERDHMYSIYSELYEDQTNIGLVDIPYIYEILSSISSIKIEANDGLPSLICTKCIDMAHTSYKFQKQCNQSQVILDAYRKQGGGGGRVSSQVTTSTRDGMGLQWSECDNNRIDPNDFLVVESGNIRRGNKENAKQEVKVVKGKSENLDKKVTSEINDTEVTASSVEKVFPCNMCEKTYKHSSNLRVHMRNHSEETPYHCKTCGKSFKQYGSLLYHKRGHTGEQPYACKICGKRYRQSGTLTAHMRVHTGQKPFLCSICGRGFRQSADLGYHMRSHTKEKPYMCNVCGKTMSMQSHLVQHMRIHTGEKPYKCTVCEKAFPSSTSLKRHAIIHTSLKPYSCDVCSKSFNRMSSLKVHAKIHTDERSHICPICGKGFIQAHALRSHLLSHTSELSMKSAQYTV